MEKHTLHIQQLTAGYRGQSLLHEVEMHVSSGMLTSIQGRNGSGKSTLLRCIAGLNSPQSGSITVDGISVLSMNAIERSAHLGAVWTDRTRIQGITVRELVEMGTYNGAWSKTGRSKEEHITHTLHLLKLQSIAEKSTAEISDGQLQQAMIARALAQCAHFLLLDEPTTYLDYVAKDELLVTLKNVARNTGVGILFTSHDLEMIRAYADYSYELAEGQLLQLAAARR